MESLFAYAVDWFARNVWRQRQGRKRLRPKSRGSGSAGPGRQLGQMEATMRPLLAILIYDRDALFREALRNFLLAAGYAEVVIASDRTGGSSKAPL